MDRWNFDPADDEMSWAEIVSVIVMIAVCLVGACYIGLRLVGLL